MLRKLTEKQRRVLAELQGDLPHGPEPYDAMADRAGMSADEFLSTARDLVRSGCLRKHCALINHIQAGFSANAMCVWRVPPDRVDEIGKVIAGFEEVTHCYSRPISEQWPYAIFSMIHGRSRRECEKVARRIAVRVDPMEYRIIYSTRELKKRSVRVSF